ncbi:MAG TPA: hypothetical protein VLU95_08910 [Candidatus Acidoferrum sp.]|nr:hypothetical protein [Candidatus Acidoferrum sp.]
MKFAKNRIITIAIVTLLMLSMSASIMLVPTASAHTPPWNIPTYAYIQAVPNPIGVGQQAIIYMWVDKIPDSAEPTNTIRFQNYQLLITAPDGTTQTQTFPIVQDPTSNQHYIFTPTQTGTYKLNFTFPGYLYTYTGLVSVFGPPAQSLYINDTYLPSSASTTLTVQSSAIAAVPGNPLPSAYWTRPIYGENPNWYTISSNWLGYSGPGGVTGYPGDAVGPLTGHIMWTRPIQSGGVVGGNAFQQTGATYFEGSAYAQRFEDPIIMDGMLYFTTPLSFGGTAGTMAPNPYGPTECVNLQTGQLIWSRSDVPWPTFGYIYDVQEPNQHGTYPPMLIKVAGGAGIFGVTPESWQAFDGYTGDPLFNVTNVPTGTTALGPNGEVLIYNLVNLGPTDFFGNPTGPLKYYLQEWNSSRLWDNTYSGPSTTPAVVPPITDGSDPSLLDWNISMPALNTMTQASSIVDIVKGDILLGMSGTYPAGPGLLTVTSWTPYTYFAVNLNATSGSIGSVLWTNTVQPPPGNISVSYIGADPTVGVFAETYKETMQRVGYSMATGKQIWGPIGDQVAFQYYSTLGYYSGGRGGCIMAYGKLYSAGYGGIIYCYDSTNGNLLWTYGNGGAGNSTSFGYGQRGNFPTTIYAIGNGVLYTITTEHTVTTPIYKGALTRGINATDGTEIWTLSCYTSSFNTATAAIADGYATMFNGYDCQVYGIGRGPSATTVSAPSAGLAFGTPVVIKGTVMDISAGTKQSQQAADFPYGVPVASDASMKDWMGYVYQQEAEPANFVGVQVQLAVLDSNGNQYSVGTATTDQSGSYSLTWTPTISGNYTVFATFAGTNGYWPSTAEDHFTVMQASTTTPAPTQVATNYATATDFMLGIAVVVIVIIIIGAVLAILMLRKRP